MWKKILIGTSFAALTALLVWGGINRTLAKNDVSTGDHRGGSQAAYAEESGDLLEMLFSSDTAVENYAAEKLDGYHGKGPHGDGEADCDEEHVAGEERFYRGGDIDADDPELDGRGGWDDDGFTHPGQSLPTEGDRQNWRGRGRRAQRLLKSSSPTLHCTKTCPARRIIQIGRAHV